MIIVTIAISRVVIIVVYFWVIIIFITIVFTIVSYTQTFLEKWYWVVGDCLSTLDALWFDFLRPEDVDDREIPYQMIDHTLHKPDYFI